MTKDILPPKTFLAISLGCRTNQAEIEKTSQQLLRYGFIATTNQNPDLILLNTCVVTQKAERETRKEIRRLRRLYPKVFLVVLGCGPTAEKKFNFSLPEADLSIPNEEKHRIIKLLEQNFCSKSVTFKTPIILNNKYTLSGRKFIKIQEGCDFFCSFCLTVYLRGQPKSTPPAEIIKEINFWVNCGIKEIILTGTNIALYGVDLEPQISITDLVKTILKDTPAERVSISSIYPEMLTDEFIKLVISNPRVSQYFHLALQSGSQTVLERMNRSINLKKLEKTLSEIKEKIPEFCFRADIIVGFPNETEKEFNQTLNFIKNTKIAFAHIFPFSSRPVTTAFQMLKNKKWQEIPAGMKKERVKKLMQTVKEIRKKEAKKMINKIFHCLIIRRLKKGGFEGLTENNWQVTIRTTNHEQRTMGIKGKIMLVKITEFKNDQLFGEILSLST